MNETKPLLILWAFSFVPYVLVSWAFTKWGDGETTSFWLVLGGLLLIRTFFGIIETLGSILSWRLYGQKLVVERNLAILRANGFPKRTYSHDDFLAYLSRIEDDPKTSPDLRARAKEFHFVLEFHENAGILVGMRMHAAAERALETYSPKSEAPVYGARAA